MIAITRDRQMSQVERSQVAVQEFGSQGKQAVEDRIDVPEFLKRLKDRHGFILDGGYGKLKGKTFRISNMGDETSETIAELIAALDECLPG